MVWEEKGGGESEREDRECREGDGGDVEGRAGHRGRLFNVDWGVWDCHVGSVVCDLNDF
jgi:hypothetical protein